LIAIVFWKDSRDFHKIIQQGQVQQQVIVEEDPKNDRKFNGDRHVLRGFGAAPPGTGQPL
jgi:hypothetical protein